MSKKRRAADYDHAVTGFVVHLWTLGRSHRSILNVLSQAGVKMSRVELRRLLNRHCQSVEPRRASPDDIRTANHRLHLATNGRYGRPLPTAVPRGARWT